MKKLLVLFVLAAITIISFALVAVLKVPHRDGGTSSGQSVVNCVGNRAGGVAKYDAPTHIVHYDDAATVYGNAWVSFNRTTGEVTIENLRTDVNVNAVKRVMVDGKQVWPTLKADRTFPCIQADGKTKWIVQGGGCPEWPEFKPVDASSTVKGTPIEAGDDPINDVCVGVLGGGRLKRVPCRPKPEQVAVIVNGLTVWVPKAPR